MYHQIKIILFILIVSLSSASSSENTTKSKMNKVLKSYLKLTSYMYQYKGVISQTEHERIFSHIIDLELAFKNTKHNRQLKGKRFSPTLSIVQNAIHEIKESYELKNYEFTKLRLRKLNSACISCHSQLPSQSYGKIKNKEIESSIKRLVKSNYEKGMYYYFLRDYKKAIKYFEIELSSQQNSFRKNKIVKEILKIYIVNMNKLSEAKSFLERLNLKFENKNSWIKSLEKWISSKDRPIKENIKKHLIPIEDDLIDGNADLYMIDLFVMDRHFSVALDVEEDVEFFYWIGLIRNNFYSIYLYSLGEAHLKQCVISFPKTITAKKCFQAYKKSIVHGFTGSAGTIIPKSMSLSLEQLEKLVK